MSLVAQKYTNYWRALRDGTLARPTTCDECGIECRPDGHHDDHRLPLEVRWLCRPCHKCADMVKVRRDRRNQVRDPWLEPWIARRRYRHYEAA
jgi:hypothetical protein